MTVVQNPGYPDLVSALQLRGYSTLGEVLPYTDAAHTFVLVVTPGIYYDAYLNDQLIAPGLTAPVDTDTLTISTEEHLPSGEYELKLVGDGDTLIRYNFSIRKWASFLDTYGQVLDAQFEAPLEAMSAATALATADADYAGLTYGLDVHQARLAEHGVEHYRRMLQALRPAYRHFAGHPEGLDQALVPFTGSTPLRVPRNWSPRWQVGHSLFDLGDLQTRTRVTTTAMPTGLSVESLSSYNGIGTIPLVRDGLTFTWNSGPGVTGSLGSTIVVTGPERVPLINGVVKASTSATYSLNPGSHASAWMDQLYLSNADILTQVNLSAVTAMPTPTVANVDSALGALTGLDHAVFTGDVGTNHQVFQSVFATASGPNAQVKILSGPFDASQFILGGHCSFSASDLTAGVSSSITCAPNTFPASFKAKIRGLREVAISGSISAVSGLGADLTCTTDYSGCWVRIAGAPTPANDGIFFAETWAANKLHIVRPVGSFTAETVDFSAWDEQGEIVDVTSYDSTTGVLTLAATTHVAKNWAKGALVELEHFMPRVIQGSVGLDTITLTIGADYVAPGSPVTTNIDVTGSYLPDGIYPSSPAIGSDIASNSAGLDVSDQVGELGLARTIVQTSLAGAGMSFKVPVAGLSGRGLQVSVWLASHETTLHARLRVSWDSTATVDVVPYGSALISTPLVSLGTLYPLTSERLSAVCYPPPGCQIATFTIETDAAGTFSLERIEVVQVEADGLHLDSFPVRSPKVEDFGSLTYIWAWNELTSEARASIGVEAMKSLTFEPTGIMPDTGRGHIDYLSSSQAYPERWDLSKYVSDVSEHLRGTYGDVWNLTTGTGGPALTNFVVVPDNESLVDIGTYAQPSAPSLVKGEVLSIASPSAPATATLAYPSTMDKTRACLYETVGVARTLVLTNARVGKGPIFLKVGDIIPVPSDAWSFVDESNIEIVDTGLFDFVSTSTYTLDYERLVRIVSPVINLQNSGADYYNYLWAADLAYWMRHEPTSTVRTRTVELTLDNARQATLTQPALLTGARSMSIDQGTSRRTLSASEWSFVTPTLVEITLGAFDSTALYTLTYDAQVMNPLPTCALKLEWRANASLFNYYDATPAWTEVSPNSIVSGGIASPTALTTLQYQQLRLTVTDLEHTPDLRVSGLGFKGIHVVGADRYAPGIIDIGA